MADGVVFWPAGPVSVAVPLAKRTPGRTIVQIAVWGTHGGTEAVFALCSDGTLWRGTYDREPSQLVWREVPGIDGIAPGEVIGFTYEPPEPVAKPLAKAEVNTEKQW